MTMPLLTISGYPILLRRSIPVLLLAVLLQGGCKSTSPTGIENGYTREEMTSFLLRHAVPYAWLPDVDSLFAKMHDGDWDDKVTASAYLSQMGPHAKKAEQARIAIVNINEDRREEP